jgi:hypothetical protein
MELAGYKPLCCVRWILGKECAKVGGFEDSYFVFGVLKLPYSDNRF